MDLNELETFVRVAEHGSFAGAARALGVPKSTVSRRVSRLEDELGIALLTRSSRAVGLTDDGRRLVARSAPSLRELDDVGREIAERGATPTGTLRITCAPDAAHSGFFVEILAGYRRRCPDVVVEVELTNRFIDLVEEGFDVALRPNAELHGDSLMGRRMGLGVMNLWASHDYLERHGAPEHPRDLAEHDVVLHPVFGERLPLTPCDAEAATSFAVRRALTINNFTLIAKAVAAGLGIGPVAQLAGLDEATRARMGQVLPSWRLPLGSMWVVWPASRHLSPRVRAFVDEVSAFPFHELLDEVAP